MCEHGTHVEVENLRAGGNHPEFPLHYRTWKIDACIAPIVKALNDGGVETVQSCCGHGRTPGRIDLTDGRILVMDFDALASQVGASE